MIATLHDLLVQSADRFPDKDCLVHGKTVRKFSEVKQDAERLARMLIDVGVSPGDRVAIHLEKSIHETVSILAVSIAGGIFVNINSLLRARQLGHILNDSGAKILITSYPRLKTIGSDLLDIEALHTIIACGSRTPLTLSGSEKFDIVDVSDAGRCEPCSGVRRIDRDIAAIIYTSGSTGLPKGVVLSHRNLVAGAESVAAYLNNTSEDRILSVLPFSFDYGLNQLTTSLLVGATLVLKNVLAPAEIVKALQTERITGLAAVPTLWSQLLQLDWDGQQFPDLRYITNSGGRFAEEHVKDYRRRLPRTRIYLMYGLTEAFRSTYLDPEQVDTRPTSIGKAIPNAEILVVNEEGRACGANEVGELVHRGAHVAQGYWNDAVLTQQRFRSNPLQLAGVPTDEKVVYSGDLVRRDEHGYLYFVGRKDHMIKTSGFRVSPTEVEEYFYNTGLVQDAVAFGVPDAVLGEKISVVLSLRKDVQIASADLLAMVSRQMPSFMAPKEIRILEALPKNSSGKLDRPLVCSAAV